MSGTKDLGFVKACDGNCYRLAWLRDGYENFIYISKNADGDPSSRENLVEWSLDCSQGYIFSDWLSCLLRRLNNNTKSGDIMDKQLTLSGDDLQLASNMIEYAISEGANSLEAALLANKFLRALGQPVKYDETTGDVLDSYYDTLYGLSNELNG